MRIFALLCLVLSLTAVPAQASGIKGPDGDLHVNFGNDSPETRDQPSGVVRLTPKPEVWVGGDTLTSANGAEFDARGHLYVSDPFVGLAEFDRRGTLVRRIDLTFPNGVVTIGNTVFTALVFDLKSPIVRINGNHQTRIELGDGVNAKDLDDLAAGPDGKLYVTTYTSGEIIKVDPWTGARCVLLNGLKNPTAARFLPGTKTMFVTHAYSAVLKVRL